MVGDILQPTHLLFVLVVALLVLGPKRLPEVGRTLGNGIRDFRAAINGESNDHERRDEVEAQPWHSEPEPEEKHEFAHNGETTPQSHEFAHDGTVVSAGPAQPATPQPAAAQPAPAQPATQSSAPAATSDTAGDKHEFAHEAAPEPAENPAGPRT